MKIPRALLSARIPTEATEVVTAGTEPMSVALVEECGGGRYYGAGVDLHCQGLLPLMSMRPMAALRHRADTDWIRW